MNATELKLLSRSELQSQIERLRWPFAREDNNLGVWEYCPVTCISLEDIEVVYTLRIFSSEAYTTLQLCMRQSSFSPCLHFHNFVVSGRAP
jgi:hypothetical protein